MILNLKKHNQVTYNLKCKNNYPNPLIVLFLFYFLYFFVNNLDILNQTSIRFESTTYQISHLPTMSVPDLKGKGKVADPVTSKPTDDDVLPW